ncbi:MAG TPA: hypothetical protein VF190_14460 [Rhodothermales bacterium]
MNAPQSLLAIGLLIATSVMVFVTVTSDEYRSRKAAVVDLGSLAGHSPEEVSKVLGEGGVPHGVPHAFMNATGSVNHLPVRRYRNGDLQVAYHEGRAVWMSLDLIDGGSSKLPFTPEAVLSLLGVEVRAPTEMREGVYMVWRNHAGFRQIWAQAYPPDGGTGYVAVTL